MSDKENSVYWDKTSKLMIVMMSLWFSFGFFVQMFATTLNGIKIAGFPLGFYMASQGSLVVFVAMLFWFAKAQDKIDRECGVAEEE